MIIKPLLFGVKKLLLLAVLIFVCCCANAAYVIKSGDIVNYDVPGSSISGVGGTAGNGTFNNFTGQGGLADPGHNYWNPVVRNGTTSFGILSDSTNVSPITLTFNAGGAYAGHAQGAMGTPSGLEIFYCYAGNSSIFTNTLNNVPAGTYNLYLYGKNGSFSDRGTTFTVWSDLSASSSLSTVNTSTTAFTQGNDYVVISNVTVGAAGQIFFSYKGNSAVIYSGSANNEGEFNGLQLQTVTVTAVPKAPVFLTQPQSQIVRQGLNATFSTSVDSGGLINMYQWFYNSTAVTNATGATLVLSNVVTTLAGNYLVVVTNSMGSVTSSVATLTIDSTTTTSLFTGGDTGEGLDLAGNIVLAEYFGVNQGPLAIQNGNFAFSSLGRNPDGLNSPNFGSSSNDQHLSSLCTYVEEGDYSFGDPNLSFTIPGTTSGKSYKLQLIFHDYKGGSGRNLGITIGSELIEPALNPSLKGAVDTNNLGVVVSYFFTATSTPLQVQIAGTLANSAYINAFALEELPAAPTLAPYFVSFPQDQTNVPMFTSTSFSAILSGDPKSLHYQWSFAGTPINGATNNTLTITAQTTNVGAYTLTASNGVGSISASANLTVNTNMASVTGPAEGQGLDLQGNIFLAECYGPETADLLINGVTFVHSTRPGGNSFGQNTPNFGTNTEQVNLATLSADSVWGSLLDFTIPTSAGIQYKLQLVFHDNGFLTAGNRLFSVTVGGTVLATNLDLAALGANVTNPKDIALIDYFTGDGNPLEIKMTASKDNPTLCALTLENLSSAEPPPVQTTPLRSWAASVGDTITLGAMFTGQDLSFQWQKLVNGNYVNLTNGATLSGATTNRLILSNLALTNAGTYRLLVSNFAGSLHPSLNLLVYPNLKTMVGQWVSGGQSLADTSGFTPSGTHDGTAVGAGALAWSTNLPPNFTTGYSLDLTASNLLVSINNSSTSDAGYLPTFDVAVANNLSISFWAQGWVPGWSPAYISKNGETGGYQVRDMDRFVNINSNFDGVTFTVRGTSVDDPLPSIEGDASAWHHYAATYDGVAGVRTLYIDSVVALRLTNDFGPMVTADGSHLVLGGQDLASGYGHYFAGYLYDVRMYGYAISPAEIAVINKIAPAVPTGLVATITNAVVSLNWNVAAGAGSYNIKRSTVSGGTYTTITNVSGTSCSDVVTANGNTYYYVVSAVNANGESANSSEVSATSVVTSPGPIGFNVANGNLTLTWTNGVLQSTTAFNGTNTVWVTESTATSPLVIHLSGTAGNKFYRTASQ
ncbi:MAG: Chitinase [Pedosphaera sp.]|nr:Chitinase [Pedosphaera sp.]